jgi:hypothetical protein
LIEVKKLSLSDRQLAEVQRAARALPASYRSGFLEGPARRLGAEPSDEAVAQAISPQLAVNRIPAFLSIPTSEQDHEKTSSQR